MNAYLKVITVAIATAPSIALATDCSGWERFSSSEDYLEPLSVSSKKIGKHLSNSEWMDGVAFSSKRKSGDVWLDITHFPGDVTAAAAARGVMQAGRLMDDSFERLVLSEDGEGVFVIDEPDLREIGCQFIWGREGGQNPIALMRELFKSMRHYETDRPLSTSFSGSLLGDTTLAMDLHNELLVPKWVISAVE